MTSDAVRLAIAFLLAAGLSYHGLRKRSLAASGAAAVSNCNRLQPTVAALDN